MNQLVVHSLRSRRGKWLLALLVLGLSFPLLGAGAIFVGLPGALLIVLVMRAKSRIPAANFVGHEAFSAFAASIVENVPKGHFDSANRFELYYTNAFAGIRARNPFLAVSGDTRTLLITPLRYWTQQSDIESVGSSRAIAVWPFYYEEETFRPRSADEALEERWEHPTKSGERDYRFKRNRTIYRVRRFGVELRTEDGSEWNIACASRQICLETARAFAAITGDAKRIEEVEQAINRLDKEISEEFGADEFEDDAEFEQSNEEKTTDHGDRKPQWWDVLGVAPNSSREQIIAARNKLAKEYHPDRLKAIEGLAPEFEKLANERLAAVNEAYRAAIESLKQAAHGSAGNTGSGNEPPPSASPAREHHATEQSPTEEHEAETDEDSDEEEAEQETFQPQRSHARRGWAASLLILGAVIGAAYFWHGASSDRNIRENIGPAAPKKGPQPSKSDSPPPDTATPAAATQLQHAEPLPYPQRLAALLDPTDWPYVMSALATAAKIDTIALVGWSNPSNGHEGVVRRADVGPDPQGCVQYRIVRTINKSSKLDFVEWCNGQVR